MLRKFLTKATALMAVVTVMGCIDTDFDPPQNDPWSPPTLTRGLRWVRNNPMFISALTVSMGPPPASFVNDYFNGFQANGAHLWEDALPVEMGGWAAAENPRFRFVSWVQRDGTSRANGRLVGGYPANPAGRIGYQIGDEPMTWAEFLKCQTGVNAIRAHDPEALLILNFSFKAPEVNRMLEHYGQHMDGDIISHDVYTWTSSVYQHLAKFRRAGLRYGKPYWRYLFSHYSDREDVISESDLRWEAFMGLVYGYTGHTWFIYQITQNTVLDPAFFTRQADFNAPKTDLWRHTSKINAEMSRLGRAVTQMTSTDVRYVPSTKYYIPPGAVPWSRGAGGDPYVMDIAPAPGHKYLEILSGFFRDDSGEFYVMVQNVRHTHGDIPINREDPGTIRIAFDFSQAPSGVDRLKILNLNKLTGGIDSVWLTGTGGNTAFADVTLAAGDPFLFKYATGAPFAMR